MPPAYNSGEAARAAATARAARRRKPRRQAPAKRVFTSGEAARGYATARAAAPRRAATFKRQYTAPAPRPTPAQAWKPTATQLRSARAQRAGHVSLGKAVKERAAEQRTGLTREQRNRPKPTAVQRARAQQRAHVSLGKAVETAAAEQQIRRYLTVDPARRREQLKAIAAKPAKDRSLGEYNIARIHAERARVDRKQERQIGYATHVKYGGTHKVTKTNVMPIPKELQRAKAKGYLEPDMRKLKAAGFHAEGKVEKALTQLPAYAMKDAGDIVIGAPTSGVEFAKAVATDPKKVPGMLAEPVKQIIKDPVKAITQRPVSTLLTVAPVGRVPGLAAGRVARVAGKQTLRRPDAVVPGTTIRQQRVGSRDIVRRHLQQREDEGKTPLRKILKPPRLRHADDKPAPKKPAGKPVQPRMTPDEIRQRVDETWDWRAQKVQSGAAQAVARERQKIKAEKRKGTKPAKAERRERTETAGSGGAAAQRDFAEREFAHEYGSHRKISDKGLPYEPKNAPEGSGVIHADKADADRIAKGLPGMVTMKIKGETEGSTGGYAVVPDVALKQWEKHKRVGQGGFTGGPVLRTTGRLFRRSVLPYSLKWLLGQVSEAGVRAAVQGADPLVARSRYKRVMKELERVDPKAASELQKRAVSGGAFGSTGAVGADLLTDVSKPRGTLAAEFPESKTAARLSKAGRAPGVKQLRRLHQGHTDVVFNQINGRIEQYAKSAMTGKAIKQGPLMERSWLGLGDKAIKEAAQGLRGTSAQVQLARQVDRAYGKYSKFSPDKRDMILHTTPFFPWLKNMIDFNLRVLPGDHPVKQALMADLAAATEEERKKARLSFHSDKRVPLWMMGSTPGKHKDKFHPIARYGPFMPGDPVSAIGEQFLPQISGVQANLGGVQWTGQEIKGGPGRKLSNAALSGAEALVPGVGPINRVTGLGDRYIREKTKKPSIVQGKPVSRGLREVWDPTFEIGAPPSKGKKGKKKGKKKKTGFGSSGMSSGGFGGSGLR